MISNKTAAALLMAISVLLPGGVFAAEADHGYGGGGHPSMVRVCYVTHSRFLPYVKIKVPSYVAQRWLTANPPRAIMPNQNGSCGPIIPRPTNPNRPWFWDYLFSWEPSIGR